MPNVIRTKQYVCVKCNQMVTFKYRAVRYKADEVGISRETLDVVLDFGTCEVAKKARVPNHPVNDELQNCPFYQSLD